ncbi:MAG TPA: CoA-binding protein [Terriglobales bacterium]|nr:CoA-binding protein [Terriglobales bacterium]
MAAQRLWSETTENFLGQKRRAMVGISREPRSLSGTLLEELCRRGCDTIPAKPNMPEALGRRCFARVQDIQPPVQAALLMTSPEITDTVVTDCAEAGIQPVWMYRDTGKGAVSAKAVEFCTKEGLR